MKSIAAWAGTQDSTGLRRWLQIGLGALWVLDGALQYQPYMFSRTFVTGIIDPAGTRSPAVVANAVTGVGHVLLHDVVLFNAAFATTQLAIGLGLLWRPAVKGALVGTMAWGLAVWLLGEGLGGILTGSATPLTGAPGAAVLYVLLAVLIWPARAPSESRPRAASDGPVTEGSTGAAAPAISVADASPLGPRWSRLCWLLLWGGSAYLLLQAPVRAPGYLSSTIGGLADSEPGWLASIDRSVAHAVGSSGGGVSVVLAIIFLLVGVAVFIPAATRPALVLAALSAAAIWVLAENLGGILTGQGTDPNTGPLLILLAAAYLPCRPRRHAATERAAVQSGSQPVRATPDRELRAVAVFSESQSSPAHPPTWRNRAALPGRAHDHRGRDRRRRRQSPPGRSADAGQVLRPLPAVLGRTGTWPCAASAPSTAQKGVS
jgi:hypothetical protein